MHEKINEQKNKSREKKDKRIKRTKERKDNIGKEERKITRNRKNTI